MGPGPALRIGGSYNAGLPQWLQDRINAFNNMHTQANPGQGAQSGPGWEGMQFGATPGHVVAGVGGPTATGQPAGGFGGGTRPPWWPANQPWPPPWWHGAGPSGGPTGPPTQQPPDWQQYWQQWYQQRQPYADWLSGYVRQGT